MANTMETTPRRPFTKGAPSEGSRGMKINALLLVALLLIPAALFAQEKQEGKVSGNYVINQTIEVGGHFTDGSGNSDVYKTFVNITDGPRLLEHELSMRSLNHTGTLFDNFWVSSFGYGGDPNNVTRLRMSKNKWYDFSGQFRRDVNFFDYNLLGNPMNSANTFVPNNTSPHAMNTRRKMGDFNLTLAPQSPLRLRLGYARSVHEGPAFATYHEGTDIRLDQDYRNRSDRYQIGADWKFAPRTQLTYDFFFDHNKVDSTFTDASGLAQGFTLAGGQPVDLGAIYEPLFNQPCSNTNVFGPIVGPGNVVKTVGCNVYLGYQRAGATRASFPTSQVSFVSSYWKKVDINLQGSYSSGENKMDVFNEIANAYVSRTNEVGWQYTGPAKAKRVMSNADFGVTFHINDVFSVSNQLHWLYWRIPGFWDSLENACFASLPAVPNGPNPPGPYAGVTTPAGVSTIGGTSCLGIPYAAGGALSVRTGTAAAPVADQVIDNYRRYLGEKSFYDTFLVNIEPFRALSVHVGLRAGTRELNDKDLTTSVATNAPYLIWNSATSSYITVPAGTINTPSPEDFGSEDQREIAFLAGIHTTPFKNFRLNADFENSHVDNPFTPISPKQFTKFKTRATYRLRNWVSFAASANILEGRNNNRPEGWQPGSVTGITDASHFNHARIYSVNLNLTPVKWLGVDAGYSFNDVLSHSGVCMPTTSSWPASAVQGGAEPFCVDTTGATQNGTYPLVLKYNDITNSGYFNLMLKPVKIVTLIVGYDLTSASGSINWYRADTLAPFRVDASRVILGAPAGVFVDGPNPRVPLGPLAFNWHKPSAQVAIDVSHGLTLKGAYNYYGYNEKFTPGPEAAFGNGWVGVVPRDFRANVGTVSLRYSF